MFLLLFIFKMLSWCASLGEVFHRLTSWVAENNKSIVNRWSLIQLRVSARVQILCAFPPQHKIILHAYVYLKGSSQNVLMWVFLPLLMRCSSRIFPQNLPPPHPRGKWWPVFPLFFHAIIDMYSLFRRKMQALDFNWGEYLDILEEGGGTSLKY